ncbi:MAG: putative membrane protein YfcA [Polyangiales bacterium]|jgi:uncharacterized membrane protein YfcA
MFSAITAIAAFVQATFGFGFAIVAVPILALIDPSWAPVPQLYASVVLCVMVFVRERKHADWRAVRWTSVGRIPGSAAGALLLLVAVQATLDLVVGGLVLVAVLLVGFGRPIRRSPVSEFVAGAASSAGAVVAAIGGPPIALLYKDEKGAVARASLALIALVGNLMAIGIRLIVEPFDSSPLFLGLLAIPAVTLGVFMSRFAHDAVEGVWLRRSILFLCALSGLSLVVRGVMTWG